MSFHTYLTCGCSLQISHAFLKRQTGLGVYTNVFVATRKKVVCVCVCAWELSGWDCRSGNCLGAYCQHGELSGCVLSAWGVV